MVRREVRERRDSEPRADEKTRLLPRAIVGEGRVREVGGVKEASEAPVEAWAEEAAHELEAEEVSFSGTVEDWVRSTVEEVLREEGLTEDRADRLAREVARELVVEESASALDDRMESPQAGGLVREVLHDAQIEAEDSKESIRPLTNIEGDAFTKALNGMDKEVQPTPEELVSALEQDIRPIATAGSRFYCIDFQSRYGADDIEAIEMYLTENSGTISSGLTGALGDVLDSHERCKIASVEGRLYVWKCDESPTRLESAYSDLYYYFRDNASFSQYLDDAADALGRADLSNTAIKKHLRLINEQVSGNPADESGINSNLYRIRGDHIALMNDISGKTLKDLDGEITKITGRNGHGGITNPKFPGGVQLEEVVARFAATALSDCTIEPNGVIKYAEPQMSRIQRVIENLRALGDVEPSVRKIDDGDYYLTHLSFVHGKLLMHRGFPPGDRTIQNPNLLPTIREGSDRTKRAYVEDVTPQDWCIGNSIVIAHRTNTLDAGKKGERYGFLPVVGSAEKDLIKEQGRKEEANAVSYALSWGKLLGLTSSPEHDLAEVAKNLELAAWKNPNRLLKDEVTIIKSLGVDLDAHPSAFRLYPDTGRVTITWQARTTSVTEALKLGIIAPPNDVEKNEKMRSMIIRYSDLVPAILSDLSNHNIDFERWWEA